MLMLADCMQTVNYKNGTFTSQITNQTPFLTADNILMKSDLLKPQEKIEFVSALRIGFLMLQALTTKKSCTEKLAKAWQDNMEMLLFKHFKALVRDDGELDYLDMHHKQCTAWSWGRRELLQGAVGGQDDTHSRRQGGQEC